MTMEYWSRDRSDGSWDLDPVDSSRERSLSSVNGMRYVPPMAPCVCLARVGEGVRSRAWAVGGVTARGGGETSLAILSDCELETLPSLLH